MTQLETTNLELASVNLLIDQENLFTQKTQRSHDNIDETSSELYLFLDLIKEIRKAKDEQSGDKINLSHLDDKIGKFHDCWKKLEKRYPDIIKAEDFPFPYELEKVHVKNIERAELTLRNLETKHQSSVQQEMGQFETTTMAHKQIVEIMAQVAKMLRESKNYSVKKTGN